MNTFKVKSHSSPNWVQAVMSGQAFGNSMRSISYLFWWMKKFWTDTIPHRAFNACHKIHSSKQLLFKSAAKDVYAPAPLPSSYTTDRISFNYDKGVICKCQLSFEFQLGWKKRCLSQYIFVFIHPPPKRISFHFYDARIPPAIELIDLKIQCTLLTWVLLQPQRKKTKHLALFTGTLGPSLVPPRIDIVLKTTTP